MLPVLAAMFRRRKRLVGRSWRMEETYVKISGQWNYVYRAADRDGDTVDFLLRAKRDHAAAPAVRSEPVVETAMGRYKALIGGRLRCRGDAARRTEPNSMRNSIIQA